MNSLENGVSPEKFDDKTREDFNIYIKHHNANKHKMKSIPVCKIPIELKS